MNKYDIAHNKETVYEAMVKFVSIFNAQAKKNYMKPFSIVHGYGSSGEGGRIKKALYDYLNLHKPACRISAENQGTSIIMPRKQLPDYISIIDEYILEICTAPKPLNKIIGLVFKKYRSFTETSIQKRLNLLIKQGKLRVVIKGNYRCYLTC